MTSALRSFLTSQRLRDLVRKGQNIHETHPWTSKLIYSSHLDAFAPTPGFKKRMRINARDKKQELRDRVTKHQVSNLPVALKFAQEVLPPSLLDEDLDDEPNTLEDYEGASLQYPYRIVTELQSDTEEESLPGRMQQGPEPQKEHQDWFHDYGTPDPTFPPTSIPCGGCGAILHCQDTAIPGYVPSERFRRLSDAELQTEICQRCYFLANHNTALKVNVAPEDYTKILSEIRDKYALVILMVDLLDFPCSLWPGIMDIIGTKRPMILVGNKVDLLPGDSRNYLTHVKECLVRTMRESGLEEANLVHTALISATTGFGVEQLINRIFNGWGFRGDIYLLGCTNVGKSSLFNTFLQSDLCKVQVVDLVQRATISPWPGTTLNLLKFPVTRPEPWRLAVRAKRLQEEVPQLQALDKLRRMELKETKNPSHATLIGHIGRSFVDPEKLDQGEQFNAVKGDLFHVNVLRNSPSEISRQPGQWDPLAPEFKISKWCFDTPGAVANNQILDQLTLPELMLTLPKEIIQPRSYLMKTGLSLFVGGLARVDYVDGPWPIRLTVCSSQHLPVTIVKTEDAEEVYTQALGSAILGVPFGSEARLEEFPPLKGQKFLLTGMGHTYSCADLVISSTGWVAVSVGDGQEVNLKAHTPNGKGLFCRVPSLLPELVRLRGGKIRGSLGYGKHRIYVPPN